MSSENSVAQAVDAGEDQVPETQPVPDKLPSSNGSSVEDYISILEYANALKDVLSMQLIRKKGEVYAQIEQELKEFLKYRLVHVLHNGNAPFAFVPPQHIMFSHEEISVLKSIAHNRLELDSYLINMDSN